MFTILHTNDFHNHLSEAQASHLQEMRQDLGTNGILLDAGDAISAGNINYHLAGEPILKRMRAIGYDAMTVGNREFHFSRVGFHCKVADAGFPVLCANIRSTRSTNTEATHIEANAEIDRPQLDTEKSDPPAQAFIMLQIADGSRIVVFGLTVPMITRRMLARKVSAYVFEDPIVTARALVPHLRETLRPDLLIALTHIGLQQDRALAAAVPGIDIIIGGHTHAVLECGEYCGSTLIVQAGCYGHYLGRIEIEAAEAPNERFRLRADLETL